MFPLWSGNLFNCPQSVTSNECSMVGTWCGLASSGRNLHSQIGTQTTRKLSFCRYQGHPISTDLQAVVGNNALGMELQPLDVWVFLVPHPHDRPVV